MRVLTLIEMPLQPAALDERLANVNEAVLLAEQLGDPALVFWAAAHGHVDTGQAGDFERSFQFLDTMRSLSHRLKQPTLAWATAFCDTAHTLLVGRHEDAERLANVALEIGTGSGQPDALAIYGSQILWARFQQGRMSELVPLVEQLTAENPGAPAFRGFLALTYLESGMSEEAGRLLDSVTADGFTSLTQDLLWTTGIADYAQVAVELRAQGPAEVLLGQMSPYRSQVPFIGASALDPFAFYSGGCPACSDATKRPRPISWRRRKSTVGPGGRSVKRIPTLRGSHVAREERSGRPRSRPDAVDGGSRRRRGAGIRRHRAQGVPRADPVRLIVPLNRPSLEVSRGQPPNPSGPSPAAHAGLRCRSPLWNPRWTDIGPAYRTLVAVRRGHERHPGRGSRHGPSCREGGAR